MPRALVREDPREVQRLEQAGLGGDPLPAVQLDAAQKVQRARPQPPLPGAGAVGQPLQRLVQGLAGAPGPPPLGLDAAEVELQPRPQERGAAVLPGPQGSEGRERLLQVPLGLGPAPRVAQEPAVEAVRLRQPPRVGAAVRTPGEARRVLEPLALAGGPDGGWSRRSAKVWAMSRCARALA